MFVISFAPPPSLTIFPFLPGTASISILFTLMAGYAMRADQDAVDVLSRDANYESNRHIMGIMLCVMNGLVFLFAIITIGAIAGPACRDCKTNIAKARLQRLQKRKKRQVLNEKYNKKNKKSKGNTAVKPDNRLSKNNKKKTTTANQRRGSTKSKSRTPPPPKKRTTSSGGGRRASERGGKKNSDAGRRSLFVK